MRKREKTANIYGFTLVEIIVVLVILTILAALLVPRLTGWIDHTSEQNSITEARYCVQAAQSIASEKYARNQAYNLDADKANTLTLAEAPVSADLKEITVEAGQVSRLLYLASTGKTVLYENRDYTIVTDGSGGAGNDPFSLLADPSKMATIYGVLKDTYGNPGAGKWYHSGSSDSAELVEKLKAAGIDLDALGATMWSINYSSSNYPKLYWTTQAVPAGATQTIAMAYTFTSGHYTVWNMGLNKTADGVLAISKESNNALTTVSGDQQTYEQMIADFKAATGT